MADNKLSTHNSQLSTRRVQGAAGQAGHDVRVADGEGGVSVFLDEYPVIWL
jgi:hypothetical protein